MRGIICTLVVLLAFGYIASNVPCATPTSRGATTVLLADTWRRTAQGWEQPSHWITPLSPPREPFTYGVRPWTIAALQLLVAMLALRLARPAARRIARVRPRHVDATTPDTQLRVTA